MTSLFKFIKFIEHNIVLNWKTVASMFTSSTNILSIEDLHTNVHTYLHTYIFTYSGMESLISRPF